MLLGEGDADGACSRAYYAMFDAARAALLATGYDVGRTHRGVLAAFSDRLVKSGRMPKEMGRLLKKAEATGIHGAERRNLAIGHAGPRQGFLSPLSRG